MSSKSVSVSYGELSSAFEFVSSGSPFENEAYTGIDIGTIYFVSNIADNFEDVPDDLETSYNYISIPPKNDLPDRNANANSRLFGPPQPQQSNPLADRTSAGSAVMRDAVPPARSN
jgi:hypothetical protein